MVDLLEAENIKYGILYRTEKLLKRSFAKQYRFGRIPSESIRRATRRPFRNEDSRGSFFLTAAGLTMTCYAFEEATSKFLPFDKYRTALATLMENVSTATITTQMDYLEHDALG